MRFIAERFWAIRECWGIASVRLVLTASLVNTFGTGLYVATYVKWALESDVGPAGLSAALSAGAFFAVLSTPLGARAGERFGSLRLVVWLNVLRGLANLLLVVTNPMWFVVVIFVLSVVERFAFPASQAVIAAVTNDTHRSTILGLRAQTQTVGLAVGTAVAAVSQLFLPAQAIWILIVVNGVTFLINALLYARLPVELAPPRQQRLAWRSGWPGRHLTVILMMSVILDTSMMAVALGLPIFGARFVMDVLPWVGFAVAVQNWIGVLLNVFIGGLIKTPRSAATGMIAGAGVCAAGAIMLAFASSASGLKAVLSALGFAALMGLGSAITSFAVYYLIVEVTPAQLRERHMAAYGMWGSVRRVVGPPLLTFVAVQGAVGWSTFAVLLIVAGCVAAFAVRGLTSTQPASEGSEP